MKTRDTTIEYCSYTFRHAYGTIQKHRFNLFELDGKWHFQVEDLQETHLWGYKSSPSANLDIMDFLCRIVDAYQDGTPYPYWIQTGASE
jgi:hypothetical protein